MEGDRSCIGPREEGGRWKRVLVPLDGSPEAEAVVTGARRVLEQEGVSATFLRVIECPEARALDVRFRQDARHRDANDVLLRSRNQFLHKRDTVLGRLRFGDPATEILRETEDGHHDAVLLSTRGAPWRGGPDSGHVAHRVLMSSAVPLLLFHPSGAFHTDASGPSPRDSARFDRIGVALDGTEEAREIVPASAKMAQTLGSTLFLITAVPPDDAGRRREAEDDLSRVKSDLEAGGIPCRTLILEGSVAEALARLIKDDGLDALAMATHGRTGLARAIFGSVGRDLLQTAGIPILMLCHPRRRRSIPASEPRPVLRVE